MRYTALISKIFYEDINTGIHLFVDGLGFNIIYRHETGGENFYVLEKDGLKVQLVQNAEWAAKDRPELRLETDNINAVYEQVASRHPELLHPNLSKITLRPWGSLEFALLDESTVCVVVTQWPKEG